MTKVFVKSIVMVTKRLTIKAFLFIYLRLTSAFFTPQFQDHLIWQLVISSFVRGYLKEQVYKHCPTMVLQRNSAKNNDKKYNTQERLHQ